MHAPRDAAASPDAPLPPDRAGIATEGRNPRTMDLHRRSIGECVRVIQQEDRAVPDALEAARPALTALVEAAAPGFVRGGRLVYLGAGTSGRLGVLDAAEAPPTFLVAPERVVGLIAGGDAALRRSSEGLEDDPRGAEPALAGLGLGPNDTLLGLTSGGTTPFVLGGLAWASGLGRAPVVGLLTCSPIDPPAWLDHLVVIPTGPEVLAGSTRMKAGTATKMALNTISTTLMVAAGRVYENLMVDVHANNDKLRDRAIRILRDLEGIDRAEAGALLARAGGSVKAAVLMRRGALDADGARTLLRRCAERLDVALGEVAGGPGGGGS